MYKISFSSTSNPELNPGQNKGNLGETAKFLWSNWKILDYQPGSAFAGSLTRYFHHPKRSCVSIYTEENPPYIDFFSIDKETLKKTLEELALDFDEKDISEF